MIDAYRAFQSDITKYKTIDHDLKSIAWKAIILNVKLNLQVKDSRKWVQYSVKFAQGKKQKKKKFEM